MIFCTTRSIFGKSKLIFFHLSHWNLNSVLSVTHSPRVQWHRDQRIRQRQLQGELAVWVDSGGNLFQLQTEHRLSGRTTCKVLTWHEFFFFFFSNSSDKESLWWLTFYYYLEPQTLEQRRPRGACGDPKHALSCCVIFAAAASPSTCLFHLPPDVPGVWFPALETMWRPWRGGGGQVWILTAKEHITVGSQGARHNSLCISALLVKCKNLV